MDIIRPDLRVQITETDKTVREARITTRHDQHDTMKWSTCTRVV